MPPRQCVDRDSYREGENSYTPRFAGPVWRAGAERGHGACNSQLVGGPFYNALILTVNLPHSSYHPLNRSGYERLRPRAWLGIEKIVCGFQVSRHEDSRHNRQHAFTCFIEGCSFALRPLNRELPIA
jgi:hypothetical protein